MSIENLTIKEARELATIFGNRSGNSTSLQIGKIYLLCSVTRYFVGRLVSVSDTDLVLEDASWIPSTGRFHDCLKSGEFDEAEPFIGQAIIFRGGLIDATEFKKTPVSQK